MLSKLIRRFWDSTLPICGVLIFVTAIVFVYANEPSNDGIVKVPVPEPESVELEITSIRRISYYHAVPWQTNSNPGNSACGPNREDQIAVSRDLFGGEYQCGDVVEIWMDGELYMEEAVVWDTMHPRFEHTVDILVPTGHDPELGLSSGYLIQEVDTP